MRYESDPPDASALMARSFVNYDLSSALTDLLDNSHRREGRSGNTLELHARSIFLEEGLTEGLQFSHQPEAEPVDKPDFMVSSAEAYRIRRSPRPLRRLSVKTTYRDRWRQILDEAARIPTIDLLTLHERVSEAQFAEMTSAGVRLVVAAD